VNGEADLAVFLAGEGRSEMGSFAGHRSYWDETDAGVLPALLAKVKPTGWKIRGATTWRSIRKLRVPRAEHEDTRNVQAVALDARESGCTVLVFSRDQDGDLRRDTAVEEGIVAASSDGALLIVGGVARPALEGWGLALEGRAGTEKLGSQGAKEAAAGDARTFVDRVEAAELSAIARDALSLKRWLVRAAALPDG
jgi:hypothetical protein